MTRTTKRSTKKAGHTSSLDDQQQAALLPQERKGAPVDDPAVVAAKEAHEAEAAFNAVPGSTPADEETPLFKAAVKRMGEADNAFADAPITSAAGALAKMRQIVALDAAPDRGGPEVLAPRHFDTVLAFLGAVAGGKAAAIGHHPDAELLARVAEFYRVLKKRDIADEASSTRRAEAEAMACELFLAIGSSLVVYPAAGLPVLAKNNGARLVILNRTPTEMDGLADVVINAEIGATLDAAVVGGDGGR